MSKIIRKVQRLAGSLHITIPSNIAELLDIEKGDSLSIDMKDEKIIIAPVQTAKPEPAQASP